MKMRPKKQRRATQPDRVKTVDARGWRDGIRSEWHRIMKHARSWDGKTALVAPAAQPSKRWR